MEGVVLSRELDNNCHSRVLWMSSHSQMKSFLKWGGARTLMINSNEPDAQPKPRATTVLISALEDIFANSKEGSLTVVLMCDYVRIPDSWTAVMLLLIQCMLPGSHKLDVPTVKSRPDEAALRSMLAKCIKQQLQEGPVVLLIDSIGQIEDKARFPGTFDLIKTLVQLSKEEAQFKLGMSCRRSGACWKYSRSLNIPYTMAPDVIRKQDIAKIIKDNPAAKHIM
jgi:hypothetical protein